MPVERRGHTACCINVGDDHPLLFVTGGLDNDNCVLKDAWLLDIVGRRWKEVSGLALRIPGICNYNIIYASSTVSIFNTTMTTFTQ